MENFSNSFIQSLKIKPSRLKKSREREKINLEKANRQVNKCELHCPFPLQQRIPTRAGPRCWSSRGQDRGGHGSPACIPVTLVRASGSKEEEHAVWHRTAFFSPLPCGYGAERRSQRCHGTVMEIKGSAEAAAGGGSGKQHPHPSPGGRVNLPLSQSSGRRWAPAAPRSQ